MHNRQKNWRTLTQHPCNDNAPVETQIAIARCLELVKDDSLDIEVRHEAAKGLRTACGDFPQTVLPTLNRSLGTTRFSARKQSPPPNRHAFCFPTKKPMIRFLPI